jgi:hypothetical protein
MNEADKVREFGNLEYEVEMNPFLEPISRAGFDPNVVKVMQNVGSHYNPNTDEIIIGNFTGTANLSEQAHEFRHRGLKKLSSEFFLNIPTLKREMPPEDFKRLLDFFETERRQNFRKRGAAGGVGAPGTEEYKFDRQEMIAEFFEEPYDYNLPAQYYAATGEDPASAKFQRVMNINPETGQPYTDEERADYAARTGTVIKKMLQRDTVQDQMDRLETVGQEEFRTFADADPETRIGDEIFKQAMLVQDFARKQNDDAKNYSEGGEVMRGIGTLNETARNMTRKPRGIGYYQQYAMGGEVSGPPPMRGPNPQGIAQYAVGGEVDEVAARRASTEDLANLAQMIRENYGFDPVAVALEQGVDPELALRVMYEESKGNQNAGSEKGARGLMQLMPGTAEELGVDIDNALDNYTGGLKYLKQMTNKFGLEVGLAAYNAGPGNVEEYQGVPPFKETQNYLRIIAEPFTGNSVEGLINTGAENFMMNQPVFNAEDVARGRGVRPMSRPPEIEFSAPLTSLRPVGRNEPAIPQQPINRPLALPEGQSMIEKYGLPGDMPQGGIMSANR